MNDLTTENGMLPDTIKDDDVIIDSPDPGFYHSHFNYKEYGFYQSRVCKAEEAALKLNINKLFHRFREEVARDREQQEKLKLPLKIKLEELKVRNQLIEAKIRDIKETKKPPLKAKIEAAEKRISDIRVNPSLADTERINMVSWIMGWVVLGCLTIYLWIFYSSASYSAFFRQLEEIPGAVSQAIFYPKALEMSLEEGFPEFLLIITMPFIFLGLGFISHKNEEKYGTAFHKYTIALMIVTFLLDALLAYEVTKKIYDLETLNMAGEIRAEYDPLIAITDSNFYVIIASGFVVYLLWGLVLSYVMDGYKKRNKAKVAIDAEKLVIKQLEEQEKALQAEIDSMNTETEANKLSIVKLEESLGATLYNTKDFERRMYEFVSGWVEWITQKHFSHDKIHTAHLIAGEFVNNYNRPIENTNP